MIIRFLAAFVLFAASVMGQSLAGLGAISGTVRDASGAVVPGAKVSVSNPLSGIRRSLTSNEAGLYTASSLTPGSGYVVLVEKEGFAKFEAQEIVVQVGQNVGINPVLNVQSQVETVTVSESTPIVDQTKTGLSQVVESSQILNLPINGRRVDTFALLTPGVTNDGTFGLITFRGMPGGNAYLTDGNDTTQQYYNENAGRTRISSNISQDAVQEFQVQSSGFSAEFGRSVGGSINTVTRSGNNEIHGTGFWFFRNESLNARDRYSAINPKEKRNQAGGSIGGPIKKDKLFYFFNGEITRRDFPLVSSVVNPQLFNASGGFIGTCTAPATAQQCQNAVDYFQRFFGVIPRTVDQNIMFGKLDWRPSENHSFSASFNILNWISPNGIQTQAALTNAGGIGNNGDSSVRHRFGRLAYTAIVSPSLVNEFRFGWFKDRLFDSFNPELAPPNGLLGQLTVQGQGNLGVANFLPRVQPTEDRLQFADNISWTKGKHLFKFGVDISHVKDVTEILSNGRGSYAYANFTNFALDLTNLDGGKRWQTYSQTFGNPKTELFIRDYNFFAQDQYRVTSRLTLNYGLRYEYAQIQQPPISNPDYPLTGKINQPNMNLAPRFGFAYTPDDSGKTVIRGGYGIFYARVMGSFIGNLFQSNGVTQRPLNFQGNVAADLAAGPVFPAVIPNIDRVPPPGTLSLLFADENLSTPYTQQWDFGVERQLGRDMGITVSYIGSRGLKFYGMRDLNIGPASGSFTYRILDAAGTQVDTYTTPTYLAANRIDRRYQRVTRVENANNNWYNAMTVQFRRRASKWMEGTVAYTWSHAIDYNQGGGNDNLFFDSIRTLFNGDFKGERDSSQLDQRHRLVVTGLVSPPTMKGGTALARQVVNGWQLALLGTVASSQYAAPFVQVQGAQFTGPAFNTTLNGFGGSGRVPFLPRTSIPIDETYRLDARLTKGFSLTERAQIQLNFEVFNVFNRVSDTSVFTNAYQASAGVLRPIANLGGGSASAGFPDGTNARRAQVGLRFLF